MARVSINGRFGANSNLNIVRILPTKAIPLNCLGREYMNGIQQIDLNNANCLREVQNLGEFVVTNVCNGTVTRVPWGFVNWFEVIMAFIVVIALIFFIHRVNKS